MKAQRPELNRQVLEEASTWFVDFRLGDMDASARAQFDEWLRRSPEHIRAYMEIARTYVALPALNPDGKLDEPELIARARAKSVGNVVALEARGAPGAREIASLFRAGSAVEIEARAIRGSPRRRTRFMGVAACLLALAGAAAAWFMLSHDTVYSTAIGERRTVALVDGSSIDLNARSKVRIRFSTAQRDVELLDGQALFAVAKDKTRPFVVKAGEIRVRAVGTEFDVNRRPSGTTVTVVEGRVAVLQDLGRSPGQHGAADLGGTAEVSQRGGGTASAVEVSAGEQATIAAHVVSVSRRADVAAATAWTQHHLIFEGSRLSDVVEDFNRYNERQLIIEAPELADFHVSGVYSSTDPASLIRFLQAQPNIAVVETDHGVHITRK